MVRMVKVRVLESDGTLIGGLFKTHMYGRHNCRMWDAPPHPDYTEQLIEMARGGTWIRLLAAKVPDLTGSDDGSDMFDEASIAYRLSPAEVVAWLQRYGFPVPADVTALADQTSSREPKPESSSEDIAIAPDGTWLRVREKRFQFTKGNQARAIQALYEEWTRSGCRDGCGLGEETIGDRVGSASGRFRVQTTFDGHPALGSILRRVSKGVWALYLSSNGPQISEE